MRALVLLMMSLALVAAGCDGGDGGDADARPEGGSGPSTTVGGDGADGGEGEATALTPVPEIVADVQPSVVSILAGQGVGSGVVYDSDGVIVTNNHVVAAARNGVVVVLPNGERVTAEVVATDPPTDLAVLRVGVADLPAANFDQDLPPPGALAIAVGNPLGFESTVTAGIVSGLGRSLPTPRGSVLTDLIQTDAAISPGNSGGALVDGDAQVMGVTVAYIPPQTGAVAIGFAIPAYLVVDVVEELLATGEASHPFLGVQAAPLTQEVAAQFGLDVGAGAVVVDVAQGAPAAEAGLQPGDVIIEIGGVEVNDLGDLLSAIRRHDPGETVPLRFVRDGERMTVEVTLEERPARS